MKNIVKSLFVTGLMLSTLPSCSKFEELNTNPDAAVNATAPMIATNLILNITDNTISSGKGFLQPAMLGKSVLYTEFPEDYQYNYLGRASFDGLAVLTNVEKMIGYAQEGPEKNAYTALGKFIRAWKFYNLTMQVGDIPYSDALKGETDVIAPKYDSQKDVFVGILKELDEADQLFSQGTAFQGDPIYNGDVTKWRKLVNTFELQVLLSLYKKTSDTDLRVTERFKTIVANRPIFQSSADNFQLVYSDKANQRYPFYKLGNPSIIYPMVSQVPIAILKNLQDYRLFYYANPSTVQVAAGKAVSDYTAYIGTDPSMVYSDMTRVYTSKDYSALNSRYTELADSEPVYLLSYSMLKFILAEATLRGWITGTSTETHYNEGITAAMKFTASHTPDNALYHHNRVITDAYITSYLRSDQVKLSGTTEQQLNQIITQRYLSTFLQAPNNDAFYENRRTGYPKFPINPASNNNTPADKLPLRWLYPQKELDYNTDQVKAAIASQYGGSDDFNQQMWLLK